MPKTFDILKKRWMEVGLLLLLANVPWLAQTLLRDRHSLTMPLLSSLLGLFIMIVLTIFRAGFLRTSFLYGEQKQNFKTLFTVGKEFFVQLFFFWVIYGVPLGFATMALNRIFVHYFGTSSRLSFMLPLLLLSIIFIKIAILIPALIITCKLNVIDAFKALKNYRILEAKELLVLFAIQQVFGFVRLLDKHLIDSKTVLMATGFIGTIISNLITIAIMLSAIKFIADNTVDACAKAHPTDGLSE